MPDNDQQPIKLLSSMIDSNFKVIDPNAVPVSDLPPGTVVDVASLTGANPLLEQDYSGMNALVGPALLNQFIGSYNQSRPIPSDLQAFATDFIKFAVANGIVANNEIAIKVAVTNVLNNFVTAVEAHTSFTNSTESQALYPLFPNIGTYGFGNSDDPDQYYMASSVWRDFAVNYNYQQDGSVAPLSTTPAQGMFQNFRVFLAVTATITDGFAVAVNGSSGSVVATSNKTPSYEQTFQQYFPTLPPGDPLFDIRFAEFAKAMTIKFGYFSPSRQFTQWVSFVQDISNTKAAVIPTLPVQDVKILNDLLFLIIKMISSIQNVAASQADRLSLYTAWQKGYTDLLNQVHVFTGSSKDKLKDFSSGNPFSNNPSLTDVQKRRQDEQGNFNAGMVQQITAFKDTVSEDAKALQSRVNQSSDAFNEQANTATAILQELSTILSAIFR